MPIAVYDKVKRRGFDYRLRETYETRQVAMMEMAEEPTGEYVMVPFLWDEEVPDRLSREQAEMHIEDKKDKMGDKPVVL